MRTRRDFLGMGIGTLVAAAFPLPAFAAPGSWVVSYLWSRELERVLDYREILAEALGEEESAALSVVRGASGNWGLIDDTSSDAITAKALAAVRHSRLHGVLGGEELLATAIPEKGYSRTHHVSYGIVDAEQVARARFELLARLLGPEVKAQLIIESSGQGQWQPIYKRYGDAASTERVAASHAKLLASHGVTPVVVADRYRDPRWAAVNIAVKAPEASPPETSPPEAKSPPPEPPRTTAKAPAQARTAPPDPLDLPAAIDTPLRDRINEHIQELRRKRIIAADERTSWYVQTLHDDRTWAAINAEHSLQCASMVKPYVALAFLHRVEEGRIIYGSMSRAKLEAMIQHSSNSATNWAMAMVGGPLAVQKILTQHYGHLLRETNICEAIPKGGRTYKNRSSARDYVRFCRALWRGELPRSAEIKRLMALPGRDRLYTGAPAIPSCTQVMNKTGTTSQLCGDFGILVAQTRSGQKVPYVIVGIIEKSHPARAYTTWVTSRAQVIRGVSNLTYQALKEHYQLV